ncbi:MAG: glycosyltransferase, partial [Anaerolineales bacterium]|nr:glycosyltransferase [Anaerolineales bacterium]
NRDYLARVVGPWVRARTHVVHCGIAPEAYQPRAAQAAVGKRPLRILHVGSLQPYKGQTYLVEACARLRQRGVPFDCRIVGGGALRAALQRQIDRLGLADAVQLLGPLPQDAVARLLPTADCYVQPSIVTPAGKMEGIPVALMEALACRVPVVATALSGVPELVAHGETGYLVPPADAAALADALAGVHAAPAAAWETAVAGRERVLREFNLAHNVVALADLFAAHALPAARPVGVG